MDYHTADTPVAEDRADEILADALAAERQAADPSAYPGALEVAASLGVAAVVVVLGYASWAAGVIRCCGGRPASTSSVTL
jgi:hypothetical protein